MGANHARDRRGHDSEAQRQCLNLRGRPGKPALALSVPLDVHDLTLIKQSEILKLSENVVESSTKLISQFLTFP